MSFRLEDYYFDLPKELIAQEPVVPRDSCRLLVLNRSKDELHEDFFYNIGNYLCPGDLLVVNDVRVIPARVFGSCEGGRRVEFLLLNNLHGKVWRALAKPSKRIKDGDIFRLDDDCFIRVCGREDNGSFIVEFCYNGNVNDLLERIGHIPLPPYIKREDSFLDREFYQTIYAKFPGAVAAPTAGLHFTKELVESLKSRGVGFASLTLCVGWGTFKKVKSDDIRLHKMDAEYFIFPRECGLAILKAKKQGNRVIAVGTTTVRVLETVAHKLQDSLEIKGYTDLFIYPGFSFRLVDGIITNFHLPCSTLIMLVSAFAGRERILDAYKYAIAKKFRFFSYGDAMLIL
ncbi:MAG: tRNA preQ1(34) S-adenosylmethionine ribosyltransferase-isomerase QueA [candidate division WOR-3 bacterium]